MRGDDVRRVRTERTEPAPRSATRDGPDATDSKIHAIASSSTPSSPRVVVVVDRLGGRRGRRSDGVEPLEGRARVPEPELDAGGLERRQRRARALARTCGGRGLGQRGGSVGVVANGPSRGIEPSRGSAARSRDALRRATMRQSPGRRRHRRDSKTCKDAASEPWISKQRPGAVVRDGVLRRLELRLFFHRERREARGERAAVEQFDEREAAAAPVRTTVAAMASWSRGWRMVGGDGVRVTRGSYWSARDEGQDAGAIPADAAEPAPEARVLGARDGPHRGLARAARGLPVLGARRGDGRRGAGLRFLRRLPRSRWRGTRRNARATPSPRR